VGASSKRARWFNTSNEQADLPMTWTSTPRSSPGEPSRLAGWSGSRSRSSAALYRGQRPWPQRMHYAGAPELDDLTELLPAIFEDEFDLQRDEPESQENQPQRDVPREEPSLEEQQRVLAMRCHDAAVACPSYGTYFFAGHSDPGEFDPILETAEALGASLLRVWAPFGVLPGAASTERDRIADALRDCADRAARRGIRVATEFHPGTLTQTAAGALDLLGVSGDAVLTYWQPRPGEDSDRSLPELDAVLPRLAHLHVLSWSPTANDRQPRSHFESMWRAALRAAAHTPVQLRPRCAYLEFVPDDAPAAFERDAADLLRWIEEETR